MIGLLIIFYFFYVLATTVIILSEVLQPQNSPQKETDIFHTNADVQERRVPDEQPVDIIEHSLPMDDSAATGGETGPTPEADILNENRKLSLV